MNKCLVLFLFWLPMLLLASEKGDGVLEKQQPLSHEKMLQVSVDYGNGYISLKRGSDANIFKGEFFYQKYRPTVNYDVVGSEGRLEIYFSGRVKKGDRSSRSHRISSLKKIYDNELNLNLSDKVLLDLDLELGVVKGNLDFSGLKVRNLSLEAGVSQSAILFEEPNPIPMESCRIEGGVGTLTIEKLGNANIKNFSFEGGVGSYEIGFGGKYRHDVSANIELGMGKLILYLPRKVGTRLKIDKSFLSSVSIDNCYKKDSYYYNEAWGKTPYNLDVHVETGVGKLEIVWLNKK